MITTSRVKKKPKKKKKKNTKKHQKTKKQNKTRKKTNKNKHKKQKNTSILPNMSVTTYLHWHDEILMFAILYGIKTVWSSWRQFVISHPFSDILFSIAVFSTKICYLFRTYYLVHLYIYVLSVFIWELFPINTAIGENW